MEQREAIRLKRAQGEPKPWTDDPILSTYRFCNVRREDDRVTIWVRENIREPFAHHQNLWFMLCLARFINWPPTLLHLMERGVWPTGEYDREGVTAALDDLTARDVKVWTGAYLIKGDGAHRPAAERRKPFYVASTVLGKTWDQRGRIITALPYGLEAVHSVLSSIYGWGPFLSYQAVVDMRFTHLLSQAGDLTWAAAGPGTKRGLNRTHGRRTDAPLSQGQALHEMRAIYPILKEIVPIDFSDVPNIMCEVDKMLRARSGEGRPKATYKSEPWLHYPLTS